MHWEAYQALLFIGGEFEISPEFRLRLGVNIKGILKPFDLSRVGNTNPLYSDKLA